MLLPILLRLVPFGVWLVEVWYQIRLGSREQSGVAAGLYPWTLHYNSRPAATIKLKSHSPPLRGGACRSFPASLPTCSPVRLMRCGVARCAALLAAYSE